MYLSWALCVDHLSLSIIPTKRWVKQCTSIVSAVSAEKNYKYENNDSAGLSQRYFYTNNVKSGLRCLFRGLEVSEPRVRKFSLTKMPFSSLSAWPLPVPETKI